MIGDIAIHVSVKIKSLSKVQREKKQGTGVDIFTVTYLSSWLGAL